MLIEIDDREQEPQVQTTILRYPGFETRRVRLLLGDYRVAGRWVFERKTARDFAQSLVDGRLFRQARRMALHRGGVWILEGTESAWADCGVRRETILGAQVSLAAGFGLVLLSTASPTETGQSLVFAARQRKLLSTGAFPRAGYRPSGLLRRQLFVLQGLPGVGPRRAEALLRTFGSIGGVMGAGPDQLGDVPGIGQATAQAVAALVRAAPGFPG